MSRFPVHTTETAPEASKPVMQQVGAAYGFVPNLIGVLAGSPALVAGYAKLAEIYETATGFDATQRQIVLLEASRLNGCTYCMAGHSTIAAGQGVPEPVIEALRGDTAIADGKLEALRRHTRLVVDGRGQVSEADLSAFFDAGYDERAALDVVLGVGLKTLSNYTNHIAHTPVDDAFASREWTARETGACAV